MNKIKTVIMGTIIFVVCFVATGCGSTQESVSENTSSTAVVTSVSTPESTPAPSYRKIGTEGAKAYAVLITNKIGQKITGISIKSSDEKAYPDSIVTGEQPIEQGETVMLYYTPSSTGEGTESLSIDPKDESTAVSISVSYDIRLTCADESVMELYDFGFSDITEAELSFEDGVAFTQYISKATGETVNTKEAQLAAKAKSEEAAKKDAAKKSSSKKPKKPSQNPDDCLDDNIDWG